VPRTGPGDRASEPRGGDAPGVETVARCGFALLPGGDAADALRALAEHGERLTADELRAAQLSLWKATGDCAHLIEAKRLLDELLATNEPEFHESMRMYVRVNREILQAWDQLQHPS
jgi:hypothetical protein